MRIGILQTGHAPEELQADYGDYDLFYRRLLGDVLFDYATYPVVDGIFPADATVADGWLITGSRFSVNDEGDWIRRLEAFVREIYATQRPLVGVCFGHQIIAKALGGLVERNAGGWVAGPTHYWRKDLNRFQTMLAWHQDQIVRKPDSASVLGMTNDCPFAVLKYGNTTLTYQAHPEFEADFIKDLAESRGGSLSRETKANVESVSDDPIGRLEFRAEITNLLAPD